MSHRELTLPDGRALSALRVVDLKEELEKRGLSKSGPKKDLVDRLKIHLVIEKEREDATQNTTGLPNISMQDKLAEQNPFIREYFESQAEQFHSQSVVKQFYDDERNVLDHLPEDPGKPEPAEEAVIPVNEIVSSAPAVIEQAIAEKSPTVVNKAEEVVPNQARKGRRKFTSSSTEENDQAEQLHTQITAKQLHDDVQSTPEQPHGVLEKNQPTGDIITPVEEATPVAAALSVQASAARIPIVFDKTEEATQNQVRRGRRKFSSSNTEGSDQAEQVHSQSPVKHRSDDERIILNRSLEDLGTPQLTQDIITPMKENNSNATVVIEQPKTEKSPIVFDKTEELPNNEVRKVRRKFTSRFMDEGDQAEQLNSKSAVKQVDGDGGLTEVTKPDVQLGKPEPTQDIVKPVEEETFNTAAVPHVSTNKIPIVFDKTEEAQQSQSRKVRRKVSTRITEEIDDLLDYGEEEKEKIETPEYVWSPRVLRLGNKFRGDYVKPQESDWDAVTPIVEATDANTYVTSSLLTTLYPEVDLIAESDVKLDERGGGDSLRITRTISTLVEDDEGLDFGNGDAEDEMEEPKPLGDLREQVDLSLQRKISTVAIQPMEEAEKELTPPRNSPTNVIIVTNLVRPFTLIQLKELLQRTGNIADYWVDKIKSKCVVKFENQDEAFETRAALHGVRWPASNPKTLHVDFTSAERLDNLRERENEGDAKPKIEEKPFQTAQMLPIREWDLGKRARERSRSPGGQHRRRSSKSPSPSRKRARRSTPETSRTRRGSRSPHRDRRGRDDTKKEPEASGKALDELFRKTVAIPCIYWLPLNPQQISEKEELRRKRMLERERRISEMAKLRSR